MKENDDEITKIENLDEDIKRQIIQMCYYDCIANEKIAGILNKKLETDFDENDVQLYLQRKMPKDSATNLVLFDELKRAQLTDEETNVALNKVSLYRAETFLKLHEQLERAVNHMNQYVHYHVEKEKENETKGDDEMKNPGFYSPQIFSMYLKSIKTLSKVSSELFKMADPVKVVSTGMKGLTREFTLEVATLIADFTRDVINGNRAGDDVEQTCVEGIKKISVQMRDLTETYIEKVELLSKNRTLGNNF
jgi:hypothetical protein